MGSEWSESTLGELVDFTPKRTIKKGSIAPFVAMADLRENHREILSVSEKEYKGGGSRFANGDTLFARITPCLENGKTALAKKLPDGFIAHGSTEFIIMAARLSEYDREFIYYLARHPDFRKFAESRMEGTSGRQRVSWQSLSDYPISLPSPSERKWIGHILGTLDDKIELNRRMNATLEGMAQALFKSWFVDFDPVIDNALAAGNPIPDELAPRAEVRKNALTKGTTQKGSVDHPTLSDPKSLFPAAFQFTDELGWIPESWETQPLYDIANFVNGAAYKGADFSDTEDALPVIKIAEVKAGITGQTKFTTINKGDKYRVEDGDILLSWSGNPDTSIDTFIWTNGPGYLNQHIFNVRLHDESERHFVYYQLKHLRSTFAEIARDKQTTGLGHFTAGDMKRLMVFKPTDSLLEQFNAAVSSIYSRGNENRLATKTLTKLRDTLLPKLIAGELRLPEAEQLTEEALT